MRRHASGIGCGARGRGLASTHPGGPGQPSGPTAGVCLRWLDAAGTKGGGSRLDGGPERPSFPPGSYGAGDRNRRVWRAERRHVPETVRDYDP